MSAARVQNSKLVKQRGQVGLYRSYRDTEERGDALVGEACAKGTQHASLLPRQPATQRHGRHTGRHVGGRSHRRKDYEPTVGAARESDSDRSDA